MPLDTTTRLLAPFLDRLTDEELDALPYGVIRLDHHGVVRAFNRAESASAGGIPRPIGRDFFADVCPSAEVPELWSRFQQATADQAFDETFLYSFSCGPTPRGVLLRMYYSARTHSVWLFVAKPDGSPLERLVRREPLIRPTPSHGIDLRAPRVA